MFRVSTCVSAALAILAGSSVFANAPVRNSTFNFESPQFGGDQPKEKLQVRILRDPNATSARIVLPEERTASLGSSVRLAGLPLVGIALTGMLVGGALCWPLSRKQLLVMLSTGMLLGSLALAQSASADLPGPGPRPKRPLNSELEAMATKSTTVESCKTQLERKGPAGVVQVFLPKKAK